MDLDSGRSEGGVEILQEVLVSNQGGQLWTATDFDLQNGSGKATLDTSYYYRELCSVNIVV